MRIKLSSRIVRRIGFIVLPLLFCSGFARADIFDLKSSLPRFVDTLAKSNNFNGVILIGSPDSIIFAKAYGMADFEHNVPNKVNTIFNIASLTKHFTGASILLLQERGKLTTDDKISKYIPDFPKGDQITIHQLLTHSAGLKNYNNYPDYWEMARKELNAEDVVNWIKNHPDHDEPGNKFQYTNSGYALLAFIIEKVSGNTYRDFIFKEFLKPLELNHTNNYSRAEFVPDRAQMYELKNNKIVNAPWYDLSFKVGSGSMYSNAPDLYSWYRALISDKILSSESREKLFSRYEHGYGYGLGRGFNLTHVYYEHEGSSPGVSAYICYMLSDGYFILILSNVSSDSVKKMKTPLRDFIISF